MLRPLIVLTTAAAACLGPGIANAATVHFTTPSGNIDCRADSTQSISCVVERGAWKNQPRKPASCRLDWAPREVELGRGGAMRVGQCRGDIGPLCIKGGDGAPCKVLRYGQRVRIGNIRCSSAVAGVTCRTRQGAGKGFRVSRTALRVYR